MVSREGFRDLAKQGSPCQDHASRILREAMVRMTDFPCRKGKSVMQNRGVGGTLGNDEHPRRILGLLYKWQNKGCNPVVICITYCIKSLLK